LRPPGPRTLGGGVDRFSPARGVSGRPAGDPAGGPVRHAGRGRRRRNRTRAGAWTSALAVTC